MKSHFMDHRFLWPGSVSKPRQLLQADWHVRDLNDRLIACRDEEDDANSSYAVVEVPAEDIET